MTSETMLCDMGQMKPCPLCGGKVHGYFDHKRGWYPECSCGLTSHPSNAFQSPLDMIAWWNRRTVEDELKVEIARLNQCLQQEEADHA